MKTFELEGVLHHFTGTQKITDKFSKKEFILKVPQSNNIDTAYDFLRFQLINDRIPFLDNRVVGDSLIIKFKITGKPFEKNGVTTYFNNLDCIDIKISGSKNDSVIYPDEMDYSDQMVEPKDDLPF